MAVRNTNAASGAVAPNAWIAVMRRLHFYIGLFIGPFLLIAAVSGVLYALTPQLEQYLYARVLHAPAQGEPLSLARQVEVARQAVGHPLTVAAVRPAPAAGDTTRIMFNDPALGESEHRAVFIDPVSGEVRGDLTVYGTSGILPLRTWIDQFHRNLLLGEPGRWYSELAASWLWVAALGGLLLWAARRRSARVGSGRLRRWHSRAGLVLLLGLVFFSATGLTWSRYAGDNIGVLRAHYGWSTPSVATALGRAPAMPMPAAEHAHHTMPMPAAAPAALDSALFDPVLASARSAGIGAAKVEIRPASGPDKAWVISEIDRSWPTRVDALAVDPQTLAIVDHVRFSEYSLAAKLTRWGIDAHMGVLFGLANQLLLVVFASGLAVMVVLGYLMWWRRRPTAGGSLLAAWRQLSLAGQLAAVAVALVFGMALPVLGVSLIGFVLLDLLLAWRRAGARRSPAIP
jgi:uncharacterized iron-regulated membrane protein